MQLEKIKQLITTEDIKKSIPEKELLHLAYDETTMAISDIKIQTAINTAALKLFTKLNKCEKEKLEDYELEIAKLYLVKETIYQLYSTNEAEGIAQDKLIEARQILKDWLGDCGKEEPRKITSVKVVKYEPKYKF
jgi:hypothetical protein